MAFWKWDTAEFTLDSVLYTHDGKIPAEAGWTWDADHFTFDDNTSHTFDGWHDDAAVPSTLGERAIWGPGLQGRLQEMRLRNQIKDEDGLIMGVITEFLQRAA